MEKDIILTVYSNNPPESDITGWLNSYCQDKPIVLNVPGNSGPTYRAKIISWCKTGDLFAAALKELKPDLAKTVTIRKRGIITFSVGWTALDELFKFDKEIERLNACIVLDGIHTEALTNYIKFATRAANMEAVMVMAHSKIIPPFVSASKTNEKIFSEACKINEISVNKPRAEFDLPDYIANANDLPAEGLKISLGTVTASGKKAVQSKIYKKDPILGYKTRGELVLISYDLDDACGHIYIARAVSKRLCKYLAEEWREILT